MTIYSLDGNNKIPLTGKGAIGGANGGASATKTSPSVVTDGGEATARDTGTKVSISSQSSLLAELSVGSSAAPFDANKVAAITQAIREGKFDIDPNKVADKLINDVKSFLGGKDAA
jgi:negative regulator of flagellin synthesis FlgM